MTTRGGARDCNHSADWEDTTGEGKLFSSEHLLVKNQSISTISHSMTRVWFTVDARSITVGLSVVIFHCADEMRRLVGTRTKGRGGCLWFCLIALEMLMVISCVCFHTASLEFSNSAL